MGKLTIFLEKRLEKKYNKKKEKCIEYVHRLISNWQHFPYLRPPGHQLTTMDNEEFKKKMNQILLLINTFKVEPADKSNI